MKDFLSKTYRGLYRVGLWLLARRKLAVPVGVCLLIWLAVQTGWFARLTNTVAAGAISVLDSLMAALVSVAGPLIALWLIWAAVKRLFGGKW